LIKDIPSYIQFCPSRCLYLFEIPILCLDFLSADHLTDFSENTFKYTSNGVNPSIFDEMRLNARFKIPSY
jgi:hypothetical protein